MNENQRALTLFTLFLAIGLAAVTGYGMYFAVPALVPLVELSTGIFIMSGVVVFFGGLAVFQPAALKVLIIVAAVIFLVWITAAAFFAEGGAQIVALATLFAVILGVVGSALAWNNQKLQTDSQWVFIVGATFVLGLISFVLGTFAGIYYGFSFFIGMWLLYFSVRLAGRKAGAAAVRKFDKK